MVCGLVNDVYDEEDEEDWVEEYKPVKKNKKRR